MNTKTRYLSRSVPVLLLIGLWIMLGSVQAAVVKHRIALAAWSAKTGTLSIKGTSPAPSVKLFDSAGRLLGTQPTDAKHKFSFNLNNPENRNLLCSVTVKAADAADAKAVSKPPNPGCSKTPVCKIINPVSGSTVTANTDVDFEAMVPLKGKEAANLKLEWDFSGGAMGESDAVNAAVDSYKRPDTVKTTVRFVRDNTRYRVRFSARNASVAGIEGFEQRCEDSVEVLVGTPPEVGTGEGKIPDMTAMVNTSHQSAPVLSKDANGNPTGNKNDLVVMPYENLTMQCTDDSRLSTVTAPSGNLLFSSLDAVVYQKDRKPPARSDLKLKYTAASNPNDPAGTSSINSTSQNWPLPSDIRAAATSWDQAVIQKSDQWEANRMASPGYGINKLHTDEGMVVDSTWVSYLPPSAPLTITRDLPLDAPEGERMPGFANPYVDNMAQAFTGYLNAGPADPGTYEARYLPLTDIDDSNRVNPYPLLRIQAFDANDDQATNPLAATDAVQTAGRDLHCRECHAKGKIAAPDSENKNNTWTPDAQNYSVYNADTNQFGGGAGMDMGGGSGGSGFMPPKFYDAVDAQGNPSTSIADQEVAALRNQAVLHNFYDSIAMGNDLFDNKDSALSGFCGLSCHTGGDFPFYDFNMYRWGSPDVEAPSAEPEQTADGVDENYSQAMHRWHGKLQYNAGKDGILRDARGVPLRWDKTKGYNVNTLFPVKDDQGNPLPMEQNCLKCHSGQREQCYRDRMYTAGVTCYQCHGDMLAVANDFPKKQPGPDGHKLRIPWWNEPDCGSCHVGSANVGKADVKFFSPGVRKLAFEANDPSATPYPVDLSNPDESRFAVSISSFELPNIEWVQRTDAPDSGYNTMKFTQDILGFDTPLYRKGHDTHGNVPCGACHGGAHAVWPNRDPNANDNVTSLQLQGHTGQILECNVCHTADAFAKEADLDGGIYMTNLLPDSGVLGGPHNTHPINDPYWYKDAEDPTDTNHAVSKSDGTTYGGWHNNYAQKPGAAGEDQCAACHGNDHKGTRLSRTPVDRVFDFSSFDFNKLKRAGFKQKVIKVAAGSFIGCNTCHSVTTSCRNSPAGAACGKPSETTTKPTNQAPTFTTEPSGKAINFVYGQDTTYSYTPQVHDHEGGKLTFRLGTRTDNMTINSDTGTVTVTDSWHEGLIKGGYSNDLGYTLPATFTYVITVDDGKGGWAFQRVPVNVVCPTGLVWGYDAAKNERGCLTNTPLTILDAPLPTATLAQDFTYKLFSADPDRQGNTQLPKYRLTAGPNGMTVGQMTGNVKWMGHELGAFPITIQADDQSGGVVTRDFTIHVCDTGQTWSAGGSACVNNTSPAFTADPSVPNGNAGATAGVTYQFTVTASDAENDTPTYSLFGAPAGMTIDPDTGVLTWTPSDSQVTGYNNLSFTLFVTDGRGGVASKAISYFYVCPSGQTWDGPSWSCVANSP